MFVYNKQCLCLFKSVQGTVKLLIRKINAAPIGILYSKVYRIEHGTDHASHEATFVYSLAVLHKPSGPLAVQRVVKLTS